MTKAYIYYKDFERAIKYAERVQAIEPKNAIINKWLNVLYKTMEDDYSSSDDSDINKALNDIDLYSCIDISEEIRFLCLRTDIPTNINEASTVNEAMNNMAITSPRLENVGSEEGEEEDDHESSCRRSHELKSEELERQPSELNRIKDMFSLLSCDDIQEISVTAAFSNEERRAIMKEAKKYRIIYREELDVIGRLRIALIKSINRARI